MRRALRWAAVLAALAAAAVAGIGWIVYASADVSTAGKLAFENPLRIPPLLEPRVDSQGRSVFDLRLQAGKAELLPGRKNAETFGVNGPHLGPTLRASRGDRVRIRVRNQLPEVTTLHWHGMHLPAEADGGPHQPIASGEAWSPSWTVDQPAATLWYHPHLNGRTEDHVYRGLAGMFLLDDRRADVLALPKRYGVDDIPLILQDKRLDDDGRLDFSRAPISPIGRLGDDMLVNGTYDPHLRIRHERVRFRVLNASTARVYDVGFADGRPFWLVGGDGGLLERPARMKRVQLSVGERAEIVVDFRPSERVVLRSFRPDLGTDFFNDRFSGGDDTLDLLEVRAESVLTDAPRVPTRLAVPEPLETAGARTRRFELSGSSSINGRQMDMGRIDEVLSPGKTEIWEVRNGGGTPHSFHPHGVSFRVLEYAGARPPAHLRGSKDTVYVPPGKTVRFAVRAPDYADAETPYMFHCHLLEHEDSGMMGQFIVSERARGHRHGGPQ